MAELSSNATTAIDMVISIDEGGWVFTDNKHDLGGATFAGVTSKWFCLWYEKKYGITNGLANQKAFVEVFGSGVIEPDFKDLIYEFYNEEFYLPIKGNDLPDIVRLPVLSCAVNVGLDEAPHWLQLSVNSMLDPFGDEFDELMVIKVDGQIGPKSINTIEYISSGDGGKELINIYIRDYWLRKYIRRVVKRPDQLANLKGWYNRASKYFIF